jgi:CarD family transcriptional regulator
MQDTIFKINDLVMYGGSGVCIIEGIGVPDISGIDSTRQYYLLKPLYSQDSTICSPVDNNRVVMRKLITKEETRQLIDQIPDMEAIWEENEKVREEKYLESLRAYSCYEWLRIIKTLYLRMEDRVQHKKSVGEKDQRYMRLAEDLLYGELAISLEIPKDQVGAYLQEHAKQTGAANPGKAVT